MFLPQYQRPCFTPIQIKASYCDFFYLSGLLGDEILDICPMLLF
jgi:hypothetical protein